MFVICDLWDIYGNMALSIKTLGFRDPVSDFVCTAEKNQVCYMHIHIVINCNINTWKNK